MQIFPHDLSYADCRLESWGAWVESRLDWNNLPQAYRVWAEARSTGGHRVLCSDMPPKIGQSHRAVIRIPEQVQRVVWAKYVFALDDAGERISDATKAELLGLACSKYRQYVRDGKRLFLISLRGGLTSNSAEAHDIRQTAEYSLLKRVFALAS